MSEMLLLPITLLFAGSFLVNAELEIVEPSKSVVVPTGGPIVGQTVKTPAGSVADIFLGIPYGEAPVGDLRFRSSLPRKRWTQPLQCQKYAPACPQNTTNSHDPTEKSEDCLFLNVFTGPNCQKANPCAVIYYVHGGANEFDSPRGFLPEFLIDNWVARNITFVTVAYRLGVLGFWSTGTPDAPGNYALWDILLGAQWIKDNIHVFGGNGSQITAVGYSSSAQLISMLTLSPLSADVFQQAILVSGTAFWSISFSQTTPVPRYEFVAQEVGCASKWTKWNPTTAPQIAACMRNISANNLVEAFVHPSADDKLEFFGDPANFDKPGASYCASIIDGPGGVLPELFETLVEKRKPIPLMLGTTTKEWSYELYNLTGMFNLPANASAAVLQTVCAKTVNSILADDVTRKNATVALCTAFYQKRVETIAASGPNPLDTKHSPLDLAALEIFNDAFMFAPVFADASSMRASFGPSLDQSRGGTAADVPVYLWDFAYTEPGEEWFEPYHAFDLRFLSGNGGRKLIPLTARDEIMRNVYVDLYANFAKFSSPTPSKEAKVLQSHANGTVVPKWDQLAYPFGFNYYYIDLPAPEMRPDYHTAPVLFWNGLVSAVNKVVAPKGAVSVVRAPNSTQEKRGGLSALQVAFVVLGVLAAAALVGVMVRRRGHRSDVSIVKKAKAANQSYETFSL